MLRKQLEIPPEAAKEFVKDMRAFHRTKNQLKGDEIAADAAWKLERHLPRGTKLRVSYMKQLSNEMKDQA
jgi:hypothetical protein